MLIARASKLAACLVAALVVGGCTAGEVVNADFSPHPVGFGQLSFIGVGGDHQPNGRVYTYQFNGDDSSTGALVSFDSYSDDTSANKSGVRNNKLAIPEGSYFVQLAGTYTMPMMSAIFEHTYDGGCTDYLTGQSDRFCALYYFQLDSCPDGHCCFGASGCVGPPLATHGSAKVLPLRSLR